MRLIPCLLAASFTPLAALPVMAQNFEAEPTYETVTLAAGFPNDPYTVEVMAGGDIDASELGSECRGLIADAPDVRLHYTAGEFALTLVSVSPGSGDTTLVVNGPDGSWYCADDTGESYDPELHFGQPASGQYDIWVGNFDHGNPEPATLMITELGVGE